MRRWRAVGPRLTIPGVAVVALVAWSLGQIFRDITWLTGLLFYIPSPLLAGGMLFSAALLLRRRTWRRAMVMVVLAMPPLWFTLRIENHPARPASVTTEPSLRAVHWNVCGGGLSWDRIRNRLEQLDADLIVLSEVPDQFVSSDFDDAVVVRRGPLAVVSRFPLTDEEDHSRGRLRAFSVVCETESGPLRVLVADLPSSLRVHRHPLLQDVLRTMVSCGAELLVGDLNAPRRSIALSQLPAGYHHASDSVGAGWGYTWPAPLPVLAIDHCVHGPNVVPVGYRLQTSVLSDHRIQVFDFAVESVPITSGNVLIRTPPVQSVSLHPR